MLGLWVATFVGVGQVQPPAWLVVDAKGHSRTVAVTGIRDGWAVSYEGGSVTAGDLVSLRRADRPLPAWPSGPQALLADGTRVAGKLADGNDRSVMLARTENQSLTLPFGTLDVLWLTAPPVEAPLKPTWLPTPRRKDVLLLASGDTLAGTLDRFEEKGTVLRFRAEGKKETVSIPISSVSAVAFDPSLARAKPAKGPLAAVTLADGSRLRFTKAMGDGKMFAGSLATGGTLELPWSDVVTIDVLGGKAVYLSGLKPKSAKTEPYFDTSWPFVVNRSVKGNPLRLTTPRGEETFDRGLGVHPKTTLVYDLGGKYRRFEATVGMDATTGKKGRAEVRVLVDGKEMAVPGFGNLTAAAVVPVSIDVAKAKELTLVVDFGPAGDVQADVNWTDARVIE